MSSSPVDPWEDPEGDDSQRGKSSSSEPSKPDSPDSGGQSTPSTDPDNPFAALLNGLDPQQLGAALARLGQLLSASDGPVNWELAQDAARQVIAANADPALAATEQESVQTAVRLAEHWLQEATALPAGAIRVQAWNRAEWVAATMPVWRRIVEPIAERAGAAMGEFIATQVGATPAPFLGIVHAMGGVAFGGQIGQALGWLASEVVSSTDIGLPVGPAGTAALLPANIDALGQGLDVPDAEVRLYLALREAAHHRLFRHVPWLGEHLIGVVHAYARGITINPVRLEEVMRRIDPVDPAGVSEALSGGMFQPDQTPEQHAALVRLETMLALVEGWVDAVVGSAATPRLPATAALQETLRRRRAAGGPAEQTFATLVGLELRPRRLRDAARLWSLLAEARGTDGRDAVWGHPDLLPTTEDLDNPEEFVDRAGPTELDLSALDGEPNPEPPAGPATDEPGR